MRKLKTWRLTPAAAWRLLFAIALVLVSCYVSRAQTPEVDSDETVELLAPPVRSEALIAALQAIEGRDPQSPEERIRAALVLQPLDAIAEARSYLEPVFSAELDQQTAVSLHRNIGPGSLIRLASDARLNPEAQELVQKIFAATNQWLESPERHKQLIAQLGSPDAEQRRVAMVELQRAGSAAVPSLLAALRTPPRSVTGEQVFTALVNIGEKAEQPLLAALAGPEPFLQSAAIQAMGRIGLTGSRLSLIRPLYTGQPAVQRQASQALSMLGGSFPESAEASAETLGQIARRHLKGEPPVSPEFDGTLRMWTWDAATKNVVSHRMTDYEAAAVAAARVARDAYELNANPETEKLLLACLLQVDQLLGGVDNLLSREAGSAFRFGSGMSSTAVADVLAFANDHQLDGAAVGACELLGDLPNVLGTDAQPTLVAALRSPSRRVRHAAARAIMKQDPRQPYQGSSFLLETLIDLADATGVPRAIVASPRTGLRDNFAGLLGTLGFRVTQVPDGRACLREMLCTSDVDVVLLSDSVSRPTADETLQQLRQNPHGARVPVILLVREDRRNRTEVVARLHDHVLVMPEFGDEQTLADRLKQSELSVAEFAVPPVRRLEQARDAIDWLSHLAEYSQTYPWYDVMRARDVAVRAVESPGLADSAVRLLGSLGDEVSQELLTDLANRSGSTMEDRQRAANAFAESVLRRGLMLRGAAVLKQYARYNESETASPEVQQLLAQILDVIETQTRPTALAAPN